MKNSIADKRNYNGVEITRFYSAAKYAIGVMGKDRQRLRCDIAYANWFISLVAIYQIMFNSGFTKDFNTAEKEAKSILAKQFLPK